MKMTVIGYRREYKNQFRVINLEWLTEHYQPTTGDEKILSNPEAILEMGGMVFFALYNDMVAGTVAIVPNGDNSFEIIKMGVLKSHRNLGLGKLLITACIDEAKNRGAKKLTLETAKELLPAIHLYEKYGFKRSSDEHKHPLFGRMIFEMKLELY